MGDIRNFCDNVLHILGVEQAWHISWIFYLPAGKVFHADGTYTLSPRLSESSIAPLRKKLAAASSEAAGCEIEPKSINITCMVRIGRG